MPFRGGGPEIWAPPDVVQARGRIARSRPLPQFLVKASAPRLEPRALAQRSVSERFLCMSSAASWGEEALYELKVRPCWSTYHGITDRRFTMAGP
jgi:hypothetical protein